MINYPSYIRSSHAKRWFRYAVLHRLCLENETTIARSKRHAYRAGRFVGQLAMLKETWFRKKEIADEVYDETVRIFDLLKASEDKRDGCSQTPCSRSETMNNELIKRIDGWLFANAPEGAGTILKDCRAEIERLSKPYVPMTDAEWDVVGLTEVALNSDYAYERMLEAEVCRRAGLEVVK